MKKSITKRVAPGFFVNVLEPMAAPCAFLSVEIDNDKF